MNKLVSQYIPISALALVLLGLPTALILTRKTQDIRQRAVSPIIQAAVTCQPANEFIGDDHLEVSITGDNIISSTTGLWTVLRDGSGSVVYLAYQGPSTLYTGTTIYETAHSITSDNAIITLQSHQDYDIELYRGPQSTSPPTLTDLIAQTTFTTPPCPDNNILNLVPSKTQNIKVGDIFRVKVTLQSDLDVSAVAGRVNFNSQYLHAQSIVNTTSFDFPSYDPTNQYFQHPYEVVEETIDNTQGFIDRTLLADPNYPQSGNGYLYEISFQALSSGMLTLTFENPQISAKGYGSQNILQKAGTLILNILPQDTPTPTPTPTFTPTPTLTMGSIFDLNNDNKIDILDYALFVADFGQTGTGLASDFDADQDVDIFDYNLFVEAFGTII